jgi:hypothetical protein
MKKVVMWSALLVVFQLLEHVLFTMNVFANLSWSVTVYNSSKVDDIMNLSIEGVNLAEYGYVRVYQYALVNNDVLFVLGFMKNRDTILSSISLEKRESIIITQFSPTLGWSVRKAAFRVFFLQNLQSSRPFVMLEYTDGNISRYSEETVIYLEVFGADSEENYTLLRQEQIAETNILHAGISSDRQYTYRYIQVDDMSEDPGPAKAEFPTVFFSDANDDGYADILVWKRRYISRTKEDTGRGSFILDQEELHVMYFEPKDMTFSALTPLDSKRWKDLGEILF